MLKQGCKFAFLHQAGLCRAQTSCVSLFRPQYDTFQISGLCRAQATSYPLCAHPRYNNWLMYAVVKRPRDMALGEVVYLSRSCDIVGLNIVPDSVSKNRKQGYNSCIHDWWAMIKDTCHTGHRII